MPSEASGGGGSPSNITRYNITRARMAMVTGLLVVLLAGHAVAVAHAYEYWPFSHYPMYSRPRVDRNRVESLAYGVPREGKTLVELPEPIARVALAEMAWAYGAEPGSERLQRAEEAARQLALWYERERKAGFVKGPELKAVRLYVRRWTDAQTQPTDVPKMRMVMEVAAPREDEADRAGAGAEGTDPGGAEAGGAEAGGAGKSREKKGRRERVPKRLTDDLDAEELDSE